MPNGLAPAAALFNAAGVREERLNYTCGHHGGRRSFSLAQIII